jgi:hypothetical protein
LVFKVRNSWDPERPVCGVDFVFGLRSGVLPLGELQKGESEEFEDSSRDSQWYTDSYKRGVYDLLIVLIVLHALLIVLYNFLIGLQVVQNAS